jgi:hypothetical protein
MKKVFDDTATHFEFIARVDTGLFPTNDRVNLFNVYYNVEGRAWESWDHDISKYDILGDKIVKKPTAIKPKDDDDLEDELSPRSGDDQPIDEEFIERIEFHNIMVATADSIQSQYLMKMIIGHAFPMLIVGSTGTGKTRIIQKMINNLVNKKKGSASKGVTKDAKGKEVKQG